jgi:hypothetical protein
MLALVLLATAGSALASGQDILNDALDGRVDACYSRAEFREALRLARDDQRLYGTAIDTIKEAELTNVAVPGQPCGSGSTVPGGAVEEDSGTSAGLWIGLAAVVGLVAVGAGAWARRGGGDAG